MANTHYYPLIGDAHLRGIDLAILPPTVGAAPFAPTAELYQRLGFIGPPGTPPVLNSVLRGGTSLAIARIVRVVAAGVYDVESIGTNAPALLAVPGGSFAPAAPPFTGEVVTFDTGGTAIISPLMGSVRSTPSYTTLKQDARYETFTPETPGDDNVFWDRNAKAASFILVPTASVTGPGGAGPEQAESFVKGDRITSSSGGSFTLLTKSAPIGSDYSWTIVRKSGAINPLDTLTNTRNGAIAQIKTGAGSVQADLPAGMWLPHHTKPNLGGLGTFFEVMPWGDGGGIGVFGPIVRGAWLKHRTSVDSADRGVRVLPFTSTDAFSTNSDFTLGGVSVQTVKCTGTFPTTWVIGETVTGGGGWSAKVLDFNAGTKLLFVHETNGSTLTAGTITGGTSAAVATADGAAYGWMPGSRFWNAWLAELTTATGATNALYLSSAIKHEGAFLCPWEGELGPFLRGCPLQSIEFIAAKFTLWITAIRTQLGNATMPVTLGQFDIRSHAADNLFASPILALAMQKCAETTSKVFLANCIGFEPSQNLPLPNVSTLLTLRPDDYYAWGERIWKSLAFGAIEFPAADFDSLDGVFGFGHSFANGVGMVAGWGFGDRDADLFPSSLFPSINTTKPSLLNFVWGLKEWQVYDIALSANNFLGVATGFGPEAPVLQRAVRRFAQGSALWGRVGNIKCAYNGSAINGQVKQASGCFDPAGTNRLTINPSCTVTVIAATSMTVARGRFTATAGTFSGGLWVVNAFVVVVGSALGQQGGGGNNSAAWVNQPIHAIAGDGSWIELVGTFAAEGPRTYSLTVGPFWLWPELEKTVRGAKQQATNQLNRTFKPKLKWVWCGEVDTYLPEQYEAALTRTLEAVDKVFDSPSKGEDAIGTVIMGLTNRTPWPVADSAVDQVRQAQKNVAAARTAAGKPTIVVNTDDLPMEVGFVYPPTTRLHNGTHHTNQGQLDGGYRLDKAAALAGFLPPHPDGELDAVVVDGAGDSGGTDGAGDDATNDTAGDSAGTDAPLTVQSANDILGVIDEAIRDGADVASYTVNGRTVSLRSIDELLRARRYYEAASAKASGLRRTRVGFSR